MNFNNFIKEIKETLKEFFGEEITIEEKTVLKNNGIKLTGIVIIENNKNCVPNIYLNDYYVQYQKGKAISEIAYEISRYYEEHKMKQPVCMDFFQDYKKVKRNLCFRIVNYERNKELLKEIPYARYLDLAMIFYCQFQHETIQNASILIRNEHMKVWNMDLYTLKKDAIENTPTLLKGEIMSMEDMIYDMLKHKMMRDIDMCVENQMDSKISLTEDMVEPIVQEMMKKIYSEAKGPCMYVATNTNRNYGASVMLYPLFLQEFAKKTKSDYYVLPSSVHEVILVPKKNEEGEVEMLKEMVKDTNKTEVAEEEILSDTVYLYRFQENVLEKV